MSRPDVSNVTEEDVMAMFNNDGELMEPENDSTEEDSTDEEPEASETEGEDESEESEEASAETDEVDWNKVDERYRKEFEKTRADAIKWQKDHGKIQSHLTKQSQSRKEEERSLQEFRAKADELSRWENLLERNPKLAQVVKQEIDRLNNPYQAEEVPDYLKNDPMFQHIQKSVAPTITALQNEIRNLRQEVGSVGQWKAQQAAAQMETQNRQYLDNQLGAAKEQVKAIFGTEATEEQVTEVLQYMVDNKFYSNGKAAALAVFGDQYEKASRARYEQEMREKAKKFPARKNTVNSNRVAQGSKGSNTIEESIALALAEQGM